MRLPPLKPAVLLSRPNRFLGEVSVGGEERLCFIPNPGRMPELLYLGARLHVAERRDPNRKTGLDLVLVEHDGALVSVDSRAPNAVVAEAAADGRLPGFEGYRVERREPCYGDSRFDLLLAGPRRVLVEVKGCTLLEGGVALFPDAPTRRGSRQLRTLTASLRDGGAAILFLIQRSGARALKPNEAADPEFAEALREASYKGVGVHAFDSRVTLGEVQLNRAVTVEL